MNFIEGLVVRYKDHTGTIRFICDSYLTLCIQEHDEKVRNVCILIYRKDWDQIMLPYEDEK
jgi:hypothetical protein